MEQQILNEGLCLLNKINAGKEKLEQLEKLRKVFCINISDAYSNTGCPAYQSTITLPDMHNEENKRVEAFQLFIDELQTIEDEEIEKLEKQLEEL